MSRFARQLIEAFKPASLRLTEKVRDLERERIAKLDLEIKREHEKEAEAKEQIIREHIEPIASALASLPEKGGKNFYRDPDAGGHGSSYSIAYGNGAIEDDRFHFGTFKKTIFGDVIYHFWLWERDRSQREMAERLALWVRDVAADRIEEVEDALAQVPITPKRRFSFLPWKQMASPATAR